MAVLLPEGKILELIERAYGAGCNPSEWPAFVEDVHAALPGIAFSAEFRLENTAQMTKSAAAGFADEFIQSYFAYYQFINPYIPMFQRFQIGHVERLSALLSPEQIKGHAFYHEWLKPAGNFTYAAGITLLRDERRLLRLTFDVPDRLGHLEKPVAELLAKLSPHVKRAFQLNDRLEAAEVAAEGLEGLIDRLDGAVFIVSGQGHVLAANAEAEALARRGSLLRLQRDRRLGFSQVKYDEAYRRALAAVAAPSLKGGDVIFAVGGPDFGEGSVAVLPLRARTASLAAASAGHGLAFVLIRKADAPTQSAVQLLQSLYQLTKAEAEVAGLIGSGFSPSEVAESLGLSKVTIRNQIAAIMAKMGVHRQAELVARVAALSPRLKLERVGS